MFIDKISQSFENRKEKSIRNKEEQMNQTIAKSEKAKLEDYVILSHQNPEKLQRNVMSYILEGYETSGGISIAITEHNNIIYAQSLIKTKTEDNDESSRRLIENLYKNKVIK